MEWNTKRMNETNKKVPKISFYVFRKNYIKPTKEEGFTPKGENRRFKSSRV